MNQAYLFFEYGLRWFIPYSGWMSINMRPPFPVAWLTFPHVLGIRGLSWPRVAGGFFMLIRYRDWKALIGISLLFPALLFATEFATVWVQDPFVLYRSYLWAIGVPGIVFFFVHGPSLAHDGGHRARGGLLPRLAGDRPGHVDVDAGARLLGCHRETAPTTRGRSAAGFPYLNRGNAYFDRDQFELAERDFEASAALGDGGIGTFNIGALLLQAGKPREAIATFDAPRSRDTSSTTCRSRGARLVALGSPAEAYAQFAAAMNLNPTSPTREILLLQMGRTGAAARKEGRGASRTSRSSSRADPREQRREGIVLAMALVSKGEHARAAALARQAARRKTAAPAPTTSGRWPTTA